jgi:hypothetical protein
VLPVRPELVRRAGLPSGCQGPALRWGRPEPRPTEQAARQWPELPAPVGQVRRRGLQERRAVRPEPRLTEPVLVRRQAPQVRAARPQGLPGQALPAARLGLPLAQVRDRIQPAPARERLPAEAQVPLPEQVQAPVVRQRELPRQEQVPLLVQRPRVPALVQPPVRVPVQAQPRAPAQVRARPQVPVPARAQPPAQAREQALQPGAPAVQIAGAGRRPRRFPLPRTRLVPESAVRSLCVAKNRVPRRSAAGTRPTARMPSAGPKRCLPESVVGVSSWYSPVCGSHPCRNL